MTHWKKRTFATLLGATLAAGVLTACGHRPDGGWHGGDASHAAERQAHLVERVARKLDLNDAQKQRLATLAQTLQAQRAALVGPGGDPRAEVRALVAAEKFDRARAQALVAQKTAAVTAGSPQVITALADFYDSLDAGQQAKLREAMDHRRRGWWHRG